MKVLKFGGSSVGTVESLRNVKKIVEANVSEPLIVVVSALGGVTDKLILTARQAASNQSAYLESQKEIIDRHHVIIDALVPEDTKVDTLAEVDALLDSLSDILRGLSLLRDLSDRTLDIVVSYGERLSSLIVSKIIPSSVLFDSRLFIHTRTSWSKHSYDREASQPLIHEAFDPYVKQDGFIGVVPGFISTDLVNGHVTNLGRGGSDYTAAILAATLHASVLEIWTDVDGFMTADPRVINTSYSIDRLSFTEAMELCNFGAKVIYPPTIYPVYLENIPIYIKNTFNPQAKGTLISHQSVDGDLSSDDRLIKGISSINDTSLISISGLGMVGIVGINARIFSALAKNGISVFMVSQASSENNTSLAVKDADAQRALDVLTEEFSVELRSGKISDIRIKGGLSTVAIVGANMKEVPGVAGKLFNTLGRNGINVIACAQGANETNISFVIKNKDLKKTLNVIHDSFFLSQTQILNLFIVGIGKVGGSLIEQIRSQQHKLLNEKALEIKVVGIANSRKALFNRDGINLACYREALEKDGIKHTPEEICRSVIGMNIFNPVFVDCTSNPDIASLYADLLSHNVNVVAANKYSASGPIENYKKLKEIARRRDVKFLFETNVGAGLPIISTLNSLINSGDKILKIEAVLSGTLNYIFNALNEDVKLSEAIMQAKEKGFSEPDPRVDLSGDDVVKKIVILAREAGYDLEQSDVIRKPFLPQECFRGSLDDFIESVKKLDSAFCEQKDKFAKEGSRYRFIAKFEDNKGYVGLEEISPSHPFYNIESSNNVVALTTDRYREHPIVIKGYGAGAAVTAAGVFADIISIANIR